MLFTSYQVRRIVLFTVFTSIHNGLQLKRNWH